MSEGITLPSPDHHLLVLDRSLDRLHAAFGKLSVEKRNDHSDAANVSIDDAYTACCEVTRAIALLPAHTFEGLLVKARAVQWCHCGEPTTAENLNEHATTDVRLAASIIRDLLVFDKAPYSFEFEKAGADAA